MIQIKYIPLFHIEFLHSYYASGQCSSLGMIPSQATVQQLRQFGLKYLPKSNGGAVFGRVKKSGNDWMLPNGLPHDLFLQFFLCSNNGSFYTITQMPAAYTLKKLMVFNNLVNNVDAGRPLLVKNTGTHLFGEEDIIDKAQGTFSIAKAAAAPAGIRLKLQRNGMELIEESPLYQGQVMASFNLNKLESGLADLIIDAATENVIYILPADAPANTIGVVEIYYRDSLPAAYQFMTPAGIVQTKTYSIPFVAAQARWRYKISRSFNEGITNISVAKPNPGGINFNTVNGATPGTFISTSAAALPLSEMPIVGITLKNQANKVLIPNLPNPDISQVVVDTDGLVYADMLVTV